jgi:hypothetical protein
MLQKDETQHLTSFFSQNYLRDCIEKALFVNHRRFQLHRVYTFVQFKFLATFFWRVNFLCSAYNKQQQQQKT